MQEYHDGYQYALELCSKTNMSKALNLSQELMDIQRQKPYLFVKGFELGVQHQIDKAQTALLLKRRFKLSYQVDTIDRQLNESKREMSKQTLIDMDNMLIKEKMLCFLKENEIVSAFLYYQELTESQKMLFDFGLENSLKYSMGFLIQE